MTDHISEADYADRDLDPPAPVVENQHLFSVIDGKITGDKQANDFNLMDGWYFWDETADWHGPFATHDEAMQIFQKYCEEL